LDALQIYKTALLNPEVRAIFNSKAIPNTEQMNMFQKTIDNIESGAIYKLLGEKYCSKHDIDADRISEITDLSGYIVKAIELYAKLNNNKLGIGDFAMNTTWLASSLLVYLNKVTNDSDFCQFVDSIAVDPKLTKEFYNRYSKKLINPLSSVVKWYRENISRLNSTSYGTISNSPLRSEKDFIKDVSLFMISKGPVYFNSPNWFIYKDLLTSAYHINWEGNVEQIRTPEYCHTSAMLAGVTEGGFRIC
jgi:hypothetical protein